MLILKDQQRNSMQIYAEFGFTDGSDGILA